MTMVRDVFFHEIYKMVQEGADIVVVTSDLGAPSLDDFRKDFPERYISVGIAEQSLIAVSAGLALGGKTVVAYGLNPFPVTRAYDQIRCLMAERKIPVTLCALNAGLCSAESGYTHMPIEDMGMTRMLSGIQITTPSDETMARQLARETLRSRTGRYIRFDKTIKGMVYPDYDVDFHRGFSVYGKKKDCRLGIVTNGCFVQMMRGMVDEYEKRQIFIRLLDVHTLPLDRERFVKALEGVKELITLEEHVLSCGMGSLVLEILSDYGMQIPVKRLGLDFSGGYYSVFTDRDYIRHDQRLDRESLMEVIHERVGKENVI